MPDLLPEIPEKENNTGFYIGMGLLGVVIGLALVYKFIIQHS